MLDASRRVQPNFAADEEAHAAALKTMRQSTGQAHKRKGAGLDAFGPEGSTPLIVASTQGDASLVAELLALGATPTLAGKRGGLFPLLEACRYGHVGAVKALIPYMDAAAINQASMITGETALNTACVFDHPEVVRELLASGKVNTNFIGVSILGNDSVWMGFACKDRYYVADVPLRTACMNRSVAIVRMLLNHPGTDANLTVPKTIVPHVQKLRQNATLFQTPCNLEDKVDCPSDLDNKAYTPLAEACLEDYHTKGKDAAGSKDRIEIIQLLLAQPGINLVDGTEPPLFAACCSGMHMGSSSYETDVEGDKGRLRGQREANKAEVVTLLLDAGADFNELGHFVHHYQELRPDVSCDFKPLHFAVFNGNMSIAEVLVERGADVNELAVMTDTSLRGITPLMAVLGDIQRAKSDQASIAQVLLDLGADPNALSTSMTTGTDQTPFQAASNGSCDPGTGLVLLKHDDTIDINLKCELLEIYGGTMMNGQAPIHALAYIFDPTYQHSERELLITMLTYNGSSGLLDVNQRNDQNDTMLHILCSGIWGEKSPFAEIILAHCGDIEVDAVGGDGNTPLQTLCMRTTTRLHRRSRGAEPGHVYITANGNHRAVQKKVDMNEIQELFGVLPSVQLMVAFGASLTLPSASTGKTAIEIVEELATAHTGVVMRGRDLKNTTSITLKEWFDATSGWSAIEVAAGCRFYKEISTAVSRGAMHLDRFELHELKRALAIAKTPADELGWQPERDGTRLHGVSEKMVRLMASAVKSWRKGWGPAGHWLYHSGVQTAVETVLMVAARLHLKVSSGVGAIDSEAVNKTVASDPGDHGGGGNGTGDGDGDGNGDGDGDGDGDGNGDGAGTRMLPLLPPELWCYIMSFFTRTDWELPPIDIGEEWHGQSIDRRSIDFHLRKGQK